MVAAMHGPQAAFLPDGRRLHLNHGPIDLIIDATGPGRDSALSQAVTRFQTVLTELVDELPLLRSMASRRTRFEGAIARRMQAAVVPHLPIFVTPMAAVAGAVADEILAAMMTGTDLDKAYVNNGGDVAFALSRGQTARAAIAAPMPGGIEIAADHPWRGVATSGWRGRSHSLGIADSVSVVAANAAVADAAATLIANEVDLPGHEAIERVPACELAPDSDLGDRLVTTAVGPLAAADTARALDRGADYARKLLRRGHIGGAVLMLNEDIRTIATGTLAQSTTGKLAHA